MHGKDSKIVIAGAGSIGCFVGGLLVASGNNVSFLGRERMAGELAKQGLTLTDYAEMRKEIPADQIDYHQSPEILRQADIVLVCVKSGATADIAKLVSDFAGNGCVVVSLQNGLRNAEVLRKFLPGHDVRAGMVPFNVVQPKPSQFHRATSGNVVVESGTPDIAALLNVDGLPVSSSSEMPSIMRGKLLLNLNNALNAISDIPLAEQLGQRNWRKRMADQIDEALAVFKAEGIKPIPPSPVPAWVLPHILRLPSPLFKRVAKRMLEIDPTARASMWSDLKQGRKTEIDELQGEIVRLAEVHGLSAPQNLKVMKEIKALETKQEP